MFDMDYVTNISKEHKDYFKNYIKSAPESLIKKMKLEKFAEDTIFIRENTELDNIYILLDGIVRAVDYRMHGISYEFMRFSPVKVLGAMEIVLDIKKYCTTLITETPCMMVICPVEDFSKWIMSDLDIIKTEMKTIGNYLLEEDRQNRLFLFLQGRDRLFVLLMQHYEKYAKNRQCLIKLTRVELSDRTGISIRTINRSIKKLQEDGFISKLNSKILITQEQYQKMSEYISKKIDD